MKKQAMKLGAALALFALAGSATASVWEFNWFQAGSGSAVYSAGTAPFFTGLKTIGPNAGAGGTHYVVFTAAEDFTLNIQGTYTSTDTGTWDSGYFSVNGVKTTFITNATQGPFNQSFQVKQGDEVRVGVDSFDGIAGAGELDMTVCEPTMFRGFNAFAWRTFDDGPLSASFLIPPPNLGVQGGNGGAAERAYIWSFLEAISTFFYQGTYTSSDTGAWDECFSYEYEGADAFTTIATNATQGPINGNFGTGGGSATYEGAFGMGVYSVDGVAGPGNLFVNGFVASQLTPWMNDVPWSLSTGGTDGTGTIAGGGFGTMTITGGNNGIAGDTEYEYFASQGMVVQAQVDYTSTDSACWDSAYYVVNGVKTTIACNDQAGGYNVTFHVNADDFFGFGVNTVDGFAGAGVATIRRFRAFIDSPENCYPDCDGDGALSIDDFICFQTFFALGDPYADCDGDGALSIDDFICFQTFFAIGC